MPDRSLDLRTLTDTLSREGDIILTNEERLTILAALAELARAAVVQARHEALLKSYGEDAREVERLALQGLALATDHAPSREPEQRRATDDLTAARARLAKEARESSDVRAIIQAAIRFAITLVAPAMAAPR